jgi:LPS export ABC transporter protein LptC
MEKAEAMSRLMLIFLLVSLLSCSPDEDYNTSADKDIPEQTINDFTIVEAISGKNEWELVAEKADIYSRGSNAKLYKIRIKFYNNEEQLVSTLTAEEGVANLDNNDIFVKGNVVVVSKDNNSVLTTESMRWDSTTRKVLSDDFVRQENDKMIVTGYGLEVDSNMDKIIIKRKVKIRQKKT